MRIDGRWVFNSEYTTPIAMWPFYDNLTTFALPSLKTATFNGDVCTEIARKDQYMLDFTGNLDACL